MGRKYTRQYKRNYLSRQGDGWRFARHVPSDLQAVEGRKTWTKYLGVVAQTEAEIEARKLASHYDARIRVLRRLQKSDKEAVAADGSLAAFQLATRNLEVEHAFQVAAVEMMPVTTDVEYPGGVPEYLQDVASWIDAEKESAARLAPRKRILAKLAPGATSKLTALVDLWVKIKQPRNPKTISKARLYTSRFIKACGDLEPKAVTRAHAVEFREALDASEDLAQKAVNAHLEKMRTMFNVALGENALGIAANPFLKVKSHKPDTSEDKQPFSLQQVAGILELCDLRATTPSGAEFSLVTRMLTYHGARSGEVCQLTVDDITDSYGIPVFRVHMRNGSVKDGAPRLVPIHPVCLPAIRAQMAVAAKSRKHAPDNSSWLFPETVSENFYERGGDYQREFGTFLRDVARIRDKSLTLHSLRHTFRDLCREVEMPEHISLAIMGHTLGKGHHGRTYGKGVSMKSRAEWLKKVDPLKA